MPEYDRPKNIPIEVIRKISEVINNLEMTGLEGTNLYITDAADQLRIIINDSPHWLQVADEIHRRRDSESTEKESCSTGLCVGKTPHTCQKPACYGNIHSAWTSKVLGKKQEYLSICDGCGNKT